VNAAALNLGLRKDRINRVLETTQTVNAGNEDIFDAAGLEVRSDTQPKVGTFTPYSPRSALR
jgi:hypothetical protein